MTVHTKLRRFAATIAASKAPDLSEMKVKDLLRLRDETQSAPVPKDLKKLSLLKMLEMEGQLKSSNEPKEQLLAKKVSKELARRKLVKSINDELSKRGLTVDGKKPAKSPIMTKRDMAPVKPTKPAKVERKIEQDVEVEQDPYSAAELQDMVRKTVAREINKQIDGWIKDMLDKERASGQKFNKKQLATIKTVRNWIVRDIKAKPGSKTQTTAANSDAVAKQILAQLGGNKFLAMTGAKNLSFTNDALDFSLGRGAKQGINKMRIRLDGDDTYTLIAYKYRNLDLKKIAEKSGVQAANLKSTFTSMTGFELSL